MRPFLLLAAACFTLFASFTGLLLSVEQRNEVRGIVDATSETDLPYRIERFGVNANLFQYEQDELRQQLELMQDAEVNWIRQIIDRSRLSNELNQFDWTQLDNILLAVSEHPDMQLLPVLIDTSGPPVDMEAWLAFVADFVQRYEQQITYYQVWDEPNLTAAWGNQPPNINAYADLLCQTYETIHTTDPSSEVIMAALAPTIEQGPDNISDITFLDSIYRIGAGNCFDAAAAKPYGFSSSPLERLYDPDVLNFSRLVLLREVMLSHDDGERALWASNFGWNSLPPDWTGTASIWGDVTAPQQVEYTLNAMQRAESEWAWLGGLILQHWQPDTPADNPLQGFSLVDLQGNTTALYDALAARDIPAVATNGLWHPVNPYARYAGLWTFSPLGADIGWLETSDSKAEFDFTGTDIALKVREGPYFAFIYPQVDGRTANALPTDNSGNGYLLLRSEDDLPRISLIDVAQQLEPDKHTLSLTADRGWDQWALAGYAVGTGNPVEQVEKQIAGSVLVLVISLFAVAGALTQQPIIQRTIKLRNATQKLGALSQLTVSLIASLALMLGMVLTWHDSIPALLRRDTVQFGVSALLSAGLLLINPGLVVTIIALVILFWFYFLDLRNGLYSILLWTPFFLFPVELYTFAFPIIELLLFVLAAAAALRGLMWLGRRLQDAPLPVVLADYPLKLMLPDIVMLVLVIGGTLALFWSERIGYALTDYRVLFVEPALFYLILRTSRLSYKDYQRMIMALVTGGVMVAGIGLVLYVFGDATITAEEGTRRLASVYGSPNNVGLYLGRCLPFLIVYMLTTNRTGRRIIFATIAFLLAITILLTQSAAAIFIGIPVGALTVLVLTYRRRAVLPTAGLIFLLIVASLVLAQVSPRFSSLFDTSRGTNFIRLRVWESSLDLIARNSLSGIGLDQFLYEYRAEYVRPDAIWDPDLSHPHNIVLDFWLRMGIWGIITLGIYLSLFGIALAKLLRINSSHKWRVILIGVAGALSAQFAHGFVDNSLFVIDLAFVNAFLLAALAEGLFVHGTSASANSQ